MGVGSKPRVLGFFFPVGKALVNPWMFRIERPPVNIPRQWYYYYIHTKVISGTKTIDSSPFTLVCFKHDLILRSVASGYKGPANKCKLIQITGWQTADAINEIQRMKEAVHPGEIEYGRHLTKKQQGCRQRSRLTWSDQSQSSPIIAWPEVSSSPGNILSHSHSDSFGQFCFFTPIYTVILNTLLKWNVKGV